MGKLYCEHLDNRNYCGIDGHKVSDWEWNNKCSYNYGKDCGKKNTSSSNCFITTVTCKILNKQDDDEVMEGLRKFRDEVLQKDEKYEEILMNYDSVGPMIAERLLRDEDREKIAETVYEHVLTPISKMVKEDKNDEAVEAYYQMTLMFINYYGLLRPYNYIAEHDFGFKEGEFDQKTAGHGIKSKKYVKEQAKILDL